MALGKGKAPVRGHWGFSPYAAEAISFAGK